MRAGWGGLGGGVCVVGMRDRLHTYYEEEEAARAKTEAQGLMGASFARAAMSAGMARRHAPRLGAVKDGIKVSSGIPPYHRHYTRVAGALGRERVADKSRVARAYADRSAAEDYGRFVLDEDAKLMRMRDKGLIGRKVFRDIDEFERACRDAQPAPARRRASPSASASAPPKTSLPSQGKRPTPAKGAGAEPRTTRRPLNHGKRGP